MAGFVALTYLGKIVVPTKLAIYLNTSETNNPILQIKIGELLFKGLVTGPAAREILKQSKKIINKTLNKNKAKKVNNALTKMFDKLKKTPSIIDVLHLNDFPIPMFVIKNATLYFVTPGATLPGFPAIEGIGFKIEGKPYFNFLGSHKLGEFDFRLTLSDGLKAYAKIEDINLPGFHLKNQKLDVHIGIPGIQEGKNLPHFYISGDLEALFIKQHILLDFNKRGFKTEFDNYFGPFGKVKFHLGSIVKKGKELTEPDGLQDISIMAALSKAPIDKALKELITQDLRKEINKKLSWAKKQLKNTKHAYEQAKKAADKAFKNLTKNLDREIREYQGEVNHWEHKRQKLQHRLDNMKWYDTARAGVLKDLGVVKTKKAAAQVNLKRVKAERAAIKFADIGKRYLDKIDVTKKAFKAAQSTLNNVKNLNNNIAGAVRTFLNNIHYKDKVIISNLSLKSDGIIHINKTPLYVNADMKIWDKKIKFHSKITNYKNATKAGTEVAKALAMKIWNTRIKKELDKFIKNL